jgi:hypothetical protein
MPTKNPPPTTFTPEQLLRAVKGWCWDCGDRVPNYLVQNDVWNSAWPDAERIGAKKLQRLKQIATRHFPERPRAIGSDFIHVHIHLCFGCLELRLKRRLRPTDFQMVTLGGKPVPENAGFFLGYALGYRAAELDAKKAAENGDKKEEGG